MVDWEAGVETNLVLILSRTASLQLSNRTQRVIDSFIAVAKGRASLEKNYTLNRLLVLAILKSLTQFGTECDQGSIKTLAAGRGLAFDSPEIKVAAIQCLTTIKSRKAEMERSLAARSNLLTDADSPVSTQTLLRPAGSGDQRDVDSLLLPASSTVKSDQIEDEYLLNG